MTLTIYVDVLFFLNIIINFIVIASTSFFSARELNIKRVLAASAFGALYSTIIFFPELNAINVLLLKIAVSFAIVLIAFKFVNFTAYFRLVIIFYTINFIYGGGMYAFYRFTHLGSKMNFSNGEFYIDLPLWIIILLSIVFYLIVKRLSFYIKEKTLKDKIVRIKITFNDKSTELNALIDSGNSLYDPISSLPVMIAEKDSINKIINCSDLFSNNTSDFFSNFRKNKLRIIPYRDATGNKGSIYAFKPSSITATSSDIELSDMMVGIVENRLSPTKEYTALLHATSISRR